jgi:hypothetical protein
MTTKRQKGITLVEFLMASSLFLLLIFSFTKTLDTREKSNEQTERSISTAEQIVKFTEAAYKLTAGIGGINVSQINVEYLKSANLLPMSFPEKTPFGQEIKGFFITSPENVNVIDILVTTTGEMDKNLINKSGRPGATENTIQERTFLSLRRSKLELDNNFNDLYHIGTVKDNTFRSSGNIHVQSVDFFNANIDGDYKQPSILLKAPNQKGFWVFTMGTWMNSGTCNGVNPNSRAGTYNRPICSAYASVGNNIQNRGFSYECPTAASLVNKNLNNHEQSITYDKKSRGGDSSGGNTYCFDAYKGDVRENMPIISSRYVLNGHPNGVSSTYDYPLVVDRGDASGTVFMDEVPYARMSVYRHVDNHNISLTSMPGLNNSRYIHPNVRGKMNPLSNHIDVKTVAFEADRTYYQLFNILNVLNTGSPTYANQSGAERSVSTKIGIKINPTNQERLNVQMRYWRDTSNYNGYYNILMDTVRGN